jgi:capsular exopolysaccharide synthesis family protein
MQTIDVQTNNQEQEEVSISEIFFKYFRYWKWFLISVAVVLLTAFIYVKYATSLYKVYSSVLIKDNQNGKAKLDYNAFSDLGINLPDSNFENEVELLKSKTLMRQVVDSLKIGVAYYKAENIKKQEIYKNTPLWVSVRNQTKPGSFIIDSEDNNTFTITSQEENFSRTFKIEEEITSPWGLLAFKTNPFGMEKFPIEVILQHPNYCPSIQIVSLSKASSVVEISLTTSTPDKGEDIINTLVYIYNKQAIEEKNYVATQTIRFIDERLGVISGELQTAEKQVEDYKHTRGLTDVTAEAQLFLSASDNYDRRISEMETQLNLLRSIKAFLLSPEHEGNVAPSNVGLTDPTILALLARYNEEILTKNRNSVGMKENNPIIQEYQTRIAQLKDNIIKGIDISESGMQTTLKELRSQESFYTSKVKGLSTIERESRELYRQKDIKESLFIYLWQKQEETGLSLALATPNAIVVDAAATNPSPVAPKRNIILLAALLIGLIIPILVIYIKDLFDNKLRGKEQLLRVVNAPFLGEIPVNKSDKPFPVSNARSGIAEKFRLVTSNLNFIIPGNGAKVIMVTSSHSGEGKSFFSRNLALSLATLGKKTLLIDIDIRKSQMNKLLGISPEAGVAMFLANKELDIWSIVDQSKTFHKNLDIMPVKIIPPNPAELLASDRLDVLFEIVKDAYDYVIVDTAPISLVADAYRINEFADATIFVTRANYTYKSALLEINSLYNNHKLRNMTIVLNAVSPSKRYGYGYGYGYSYGYGKKGDNYYIGEDNG